MADRDEKNPFHENTLTQLSDACRRMLDEIDAEGPRTKQQRLDLTKRVRFLLIVLSNHIAPPRYIPGEPEDALRRGPPASVFDEYAKWHAKERDRGASAVRMRTLRRAADWVLGQAAEFWIRPKEGHIDDFPQSRASDSEEGLLECLRELDAIDRSRLRGT